MSDFKKDILEILFPSDFKCVCCGEEISNEDFLICENCYKKLPWINGKVCEVCGEPIKSESKLCMQCKSKLPYFKKCVSLFKYEEPISSLIKNFKYNNATYLQKTLATFILKSFLKLNEKVDVVIPVPLHYNRFKHRGFNQSEEICYYLKSLLNLSVNTNAVVRKIDTQTQTELNRKQRCENLKDAFVVVDKNAIKNKTVLLVDDVYTTGSTLNEVAKTLIKAKVKNVFAITIAHNTIETNLLEEFKKWKICYFSIFFIFFSFICCKSNLKTCIKVNFL